MSTLTGPLSVSAVMVTCLLNSLLRLHSALFSCLRNRLKSTISFIVASLNVFFASSPLSPRLSGFSKIFFWSIA